MDILSILFDIIYKISSQLSTSVTLMDAFIPRKSANTTNQGTMSVSDREIQWLDTSQHSFDSNVLTLAMIFFETFRLRDILS